MCAYKNKVVFIQSEQIFESDTRKTYLKIKISQLLTSNDENDIFEFIKEHASKNKIYNFVLHIDSGTLRKLIPLMAEKKINSKKTRKLLAKCTFVATYSNADSVRELNKEEDTGISFALSPLSEVLRSLPDGTVIKTEEQEEEQSKKEVMVVISDTDSPYYQQIDEHFVSEEGTTLVKYKVSELTVDLINDFVENEGYSMVLALDTEEEFDDVGQKIFDSMFKKQLHIIECTQPASDGVRKMQAKASDIQTYSSGVCINGTEYSGLNTLIAYEKCAAILTQLWNSLNKLKKANVFA
jgi:hypothetical protein